jgi:hypothetical protein
MSEAFAVQMKGFGIDVVLFKRLLLVTSSDAAVRVSLSEFMTTFSYRTLDSWSRERRVTGKTEILDRGPNPRFVVTSLFSGLGQAVDLYEQIYCARGEMENCIKEQQLYLFADRTSAHLMRVNQIRLWFSSQAAEKPGIAVKLSQSRRTEMRGDDRRQGSMFSYVSLEQRVPESHPLRPLRAMVDQALVELSPAFEGLY